MSCPSLDEIPSPALIGELLKRIEFMKMGNCPHCGQRLLTYTPTQMICKCRFGTQLKGYHDPALVTHYLSLLTEIS